MTKPSIVSFFVCFFSFKWCYLLTSFIAFAEDESMPYTLNGNGVSTEAIESIPDWVVEVADDMDVYVAQRDFEEAVSLAEKTRTFWDGASPSVINLHRDLKYYISRRQQTLNFLYYVFF